VLDLREASDAKSPTLREISDAKSLTSSLTNLAVSAADLAISDAVLMLRHWQHSGAGAVGWLFLTEFPACFVREPEPCFSLWLWQLTHRKGARPNRAGELL
jgi:hypothetical protein